MSDIKAKIVNLFKQPSMVSLATVFEGKPWVRYVMAVTDENLTFRIATFISSRKIAQIKADPEVHITGGIENMETAKQYAQIQGKAEVVTNQDAKSAFWNDGLKSYFKGADDPNYCLLVIKPYRIELMSMQNPVPEIWEG